MPKYEKPCVTVDVVLVNQIEPNFEILLIKRKQDPFKGKWAIPGGHVDEGESLEQAAARECKEETNIQLEINPTQLWQYGAYGNPGRDPRGWYISIVFGAKITSHQRQQAKAASDAAELGWFSLADACQLSLAFDHNKILKDISLRRRF